MNTIAELTYRVATPQGTLTRIMRAGDERDSDPTEVRNTKRLEEALRTRDAWVRNYDPTMTVTVVACDAQGRSPAVGSGMTYEQARELIWSPDDHAIEDVAGASEVVLSERGAPSRDIHQATHLITTMRPR